MQALKPGDTVELIAPASRCSDQQVADIKALLQSWDLVCLVNDNLFGQDLLCANSDEARLKLLEQALVNPDSKALICVRGGYGAMRLIPKLQTLQKPKTAKLFVGMSDITALHLFLQQQWAWATIHGAATLGQFSPESIASLKALLFGETKSIEFKGTPLNPQALSNQTLLSSVTGGNLTLLQTSIGTSWELQAQNKIILIEEINERGYRVDRMLEHLVQAQVLDGAKAIVFGDFLKGEEPDGSSLIQPVLARFAANCAIPVVQIQGIGHGYVNFPIPFGTEAKLQLGEEIRLSSLSLCGRTV
jgi:muramoyltetrapeptide carboxypeptidase